MISELHVKSRDSSRMPGREDGLCIYGFFLSNHMPYWLTNQYIDRDRKQQILQDVIVNTSAGHHTWPSVLAHTTFPGVAARELLSQTYDSRRVDSDILEISIFSLQAALYRNQKLKSFSLLRNKKAERSQTQLICTSTLAQNKPMSTKVETFILNSWINFHNRSIKRLRWTYRSTLLVKAASNQHIFRKLFHCHSPPLQTAWSNIGQPHFTRRWIWWGTCMEEWVRWKISHLFQQNSIKVCLWRRKTDTEFKS